MVQRQELRVVPPKPPSWLCHRASPFPALWETEARLPSQRHLVFSSFLTVSSCFLHPQRKPLWVSLLRTDTRRLRGWCVPPRVTGIALVSVGRMGTNECPAPALGKGKIPGCRAGEENCLGLNSWALRVAIYGCTFCSKPDARHCKRERKQTGESQPEREKPGGKGEGRSL